MCVSTLREALCAFYALGTASETSINEAYLNLPTGQHDQ